MRDNRFDPTTELVIAGIDTQDGPEHPCFDGDSNREDVPRAMVEFMAHTGFFGSVVVKTMGTARYVVDGRTRVRAARLANEKRAKLGLDPLKVPVTPWQATDKAGIMAVVMAANDLRRKEKSVMARVRQVVQAKNGGMTNEDISKAAGVTVNAVKNWGRISELALEVQEAIDRGVISADAALTWHDRPAAKQVELLQALLNPTAESPSTAVVEEPKAAAKTKVAKRRSKAKADKPKRINRRAAQEAAGKVVRRGRKTIRKIIALPNCAFSEKQKLAVQWAIGDVSDKDAGLFKP